MISSCLVTDVTQTGCGGNMNKVNNPRALRRVHMLVILDYEHNCSIVFDLNGNPVASCLTCEGEQEVLASMGLGEDAWRTSDSSTEEWAYFWSDRDGERDY